MSAVQPHVETQTDTFLGGTWFADDPPSQTQFFNRPKHPGWPFPPESDDIQMVCLFIITTTGLDKAAQDFLDVADLASGKIGYVCKRNFMVAEQCGKVSCAFSVTTTPRMVGNAESICHFAPHDTATRRSVGNDLMVMMANALQARGHKLLPTIQDFQQ